MTMKKKVSTLEYRYVKGLLLLTLFLTLTICLILSVHIKKIMMEGYRNMAYALTRSMANSLTGEQVERYYRTGNIDGAYLEIDSEMRKTVETYGLSYFYVMIPRKNDVVYIWDATSPQPGDELGSTEAYLTEIEREMVELTLRPDPVEELFEDDDPEYGLLMTAASPVFDNHSNPVALVCVDISIPNVEQAKWAAYLQVAIAVLLVMGVANFLYFLSIRHKVIYPLRKLTGATSEIASHLDKDECYHNDIQTNDEIQTLSESFEKMDEKLHHILADNLRITAEKERIRAELDMAAAIQESQLPRVFPAFPDRKEFDICADMKPAKEVGGDFYDFYLVNEDQLAVVIADVSGKGIPAALFMMITRVLIKNRLQAGESPKDVLGHVNNELLENNEESLFITVWIMLLELSTGKCITANAGHEYPVYRRYGYEHELIRKKHSLPVAAVEGISYEQEEFMLHPGDSVFVYTDGVTETTNQEEELFGTDRLLASLDRDSDADPKQQIETVMADLKRFAAGAMQFDDITMVSLKYYGFMAQELKEEEQKQKP